MVDLLNCPFCGSGAYMGSFDHRVKGRVKYTLFNVHCKAEECYSASGVSCKSVASAVKQWNTRTPDTMKDLQENIGDSDD